VTVPFEITTLESSPVLEIAYVVMNSNFKQVLVQLPGASPGGGEGTSMFEIADLQLSKSGDISVMQLNLVSQGPKRAGREISRDRATGFLCLSLQGIRSTAVSAFGSGLASAAASVEILHRAGSAYRRNRSRRHRILGAGCLPCPSGPGSDSRYPLLRKLGPE